MPNSFSKILTIFLGVLVAVSATLVFLFYSNVTGDKNLDESEMPFLNIFFNWGIFLTILAIVVAIISPVFTIFQNPKSSIKSLISIFGLGLLFFVSYLFSSGDLLKLTTENSGNVSEMLKLGDTLLFSTYILSILGIISIIVSEIVKFFR